MSPLWVSPWSSRTACSPTTSRTSRPGRKVYRRDLSSSARRASWAVRGSTAASRSQYRAASNAPRRAGFSARASPGVSSLWPRAAASGRATAASATARSRSPRSGVREPFARKPSAGTRAPISSHSSRARSAVSSSSPPARPLTQIWPKLRSEAPRASLSRSICTTSWPRLTACQACMVPTTPAPTTMTLTAATLLGIGEPETSGRRRERELGVTFGLDPLPFRDFGSEPGRAFSGRRTVRRRRPAVRGARYAVRGPRSGRCQPCRRVVKEKRSPR